MKLVYTIAGLFIFLLIFTVTDVGIEKCLDVKQKVEYQRKSLESYRFITESFRKTCNGEGFNSLNEWQQKCGSLWELEYIGWANANEFLEVENKESGELFYGRWIGPFGNGEVYCRKK